ncbi:hypothetical protein ACVFYP_22175 [Roseomonas sp. F4]
MNKLSAKSLTEDVLARSAPEEVFLVESYDPETANSGSTSTGPAGFGAAEAITLLLPFVYSFFNKFVEAAGTEAGKKGFAFVFEWLRANSDKDQAAAREQIKETLAASGLPAAALDSTADSIMETLRKAG